MPRPPTDDRRAELAALEALAAALQAASAARPPGGPPMVIRVDALLAELGDPRVGVVVKVGGTNGKGSVAAMLQACCLRADLDVVTFTGPHLSRLTERITVNGAEVHPVALAHALREAEAAGDAVVARLGPGARPSFFELLLAAALILARARGAEALIIEAGIGGRGDATSRLSAQVAALVSVGADHLAQLGPTLEHVAAEKAGLARPGEVLIVGPGVTPALLTVVHAAAEPGVRVVQAPGLVGEGGPHVTVQLPGLGPARLSLAGAHQAENAAVVAVVWAELHRQGLVPLDALLGVTEARWPGRLELLPGAPAWLLDGAHNPPGVAALAQALPAYWSESERVLLVGVSGGHEAALLALAELPGELHLVGGFYRAASIAAMMALLPPGRVTACWPEVSTAVAALSVRRDKALIVVAGSLFLVGAAREVLV